MKIKISALAILFATLAHGMEEKSWGITLLGTKINVNKGNIFDAYADDKSKVDFVVVEKYAKPSKNAPARLASSYFPNKDYNICLDVEDPCFAVGCLGGVYYKPKPFQCEIHLGGVLYITDKQVDLALKDIAMFYQTTFTKAAYGRLGTSIALSTFGVQQFDNPDLLESYAQYIYPFLRKKCVPVAIKAIFTFIKNNPEAYDRIEFFVERDFEFDLYKECLQKYAEKLQKYRHLLEKYPTAGTL